MAYHKSAEKRHRQTTKRNARNTTLKSEVRSAIKAARAAAEADPATAAAAIKLAQVELARAGTKGVFHKRAVARRIGRLQLLANKAARGELKADTHHKHHGKPAKGAAKAKTAKPAKK
ncbi:MAG: 30S ribosomal protein S20 [Deltaproteobacteria bacterium]|nr:30S ribosomal protein S20 [Deltaproteobacteria bacterium]